MRLLRLLRKGCRQLNADIEGFFQGFGPNGAFCIMCLLVIPVLLTGCAVFLSVEESGGFGPMVPLLASLSLAFSIIRRYYKAEVRRAKEERIQRGLREAPETWSRFSANTPHAPDTVIDFDRFNRGTVYKCLTPWQYASSERSWLKGKLEPAGWALTEFQAHYSSRYGEKRYTGYDFYFKKGPDILRVSAGGGSLSVQPVTLVYTDEDYGIGQYRTSGYTANIRKAEEILEGGPTWTQSLSKNMRQKRN